MAIRLLCSAHVRMTGEAPCPTRPNPRLIGAIADLTIARNRLLDAIDSLSAERND